MGAILEENIPLTFHRLGLRFTDLSAWINRSGFSIEYKNEPWGFQINYSKPESIEVDLYEELKFAIGCSASGPQIGWPLKEVHASETDWVSILGPSEIGIDRLLVMAGRICDFLSLVLGCPVFFTEMQGQTEQAKEVIASSTYYTTIKIYMTPLERPRNHRPINNPGEVLLPLSEIQDQLRDVLSAWFANSSRIEPALQLYFSTLYESVIHVERHFLFLTQAVETYHRRTSDETHLPEEEHVERRDAILAAVPEKYQEWLESKLMYSNELSLRRRIKRLINRFSTILDGYIDKRAFVNKVVITRNYLTHYDEDLAEKAAKGTVEFLDLIYKLRTILEACFLSEIGLPDDQIGHILGEKIKERLDIIASNKTA